MQNQFCTCRRFGSSRTILQSILENILSYHTARRITWICVYVWSGTPVVGKLRVHRTPKVVPRLEYQTIDTEPRDMTPGCVIWSIGTHTVAENKFVPIIKSFLLPKRFNYRGSTVHDLGMHAGLYTLIIFSSPWEYPWRSPGQTESHDKMYGG